MECGRRRLNQRAGRDKTGDTNYPDNQRAHDSLQFSTDWHFD
jgi:hypothetical protein